MASVGFQLSSSSPLFLPCSSWKQASAETAPRSPTLLSPPHCSLHFAKHPREKSSAFPPPADPAGAAARWPWTWTWTGAGASSELRGVPDCTAIVKIQNQGSLCNRCFDSQRLFYAVLSFPSSTALFFFFLHVRNGMVICWIIEELGRIFSGS